MMDSKSVDSDSESVDSFDSAGPSELIPRDDLFPSVEYLTWKDIQFERLTSDITDGVASLFRGDITEVRKALIWGKIKSDFDSRAANELGDGSVAVAFERLRQLRTKFRVLELEFSLTDEHALFLENQTLLMFLRMVMYVYLLYSIFSVVI